MANYISSSIKQSLDLEVNVTNVSVVVNQLKEIGKEAKSQSKIIEENAKKITEHYEKMSKGIKEATKETSSFVGAIGKALDIDTTNLKSATSMVDNIGGAAANVAGLMAGNFTSAIGLAGNLVSIIADLPGTVAAVGEMIDKAFNGRNIRIAERVAEETAASTERVNEMYARMETRTAENAATLDSIYVDSEVAGKLIDRIRDLGDITNLSAKEQQELLTIVGLLNDMFPELGLAIDEETGQLNKNVDELRNYADAQKNAALSAAYAEILKENMIELLRIEREQKKTHTEMMVQAEKLDEAKERSANLTDAQAKAEKYYTDELGHAKKMTDEQRKELEALGITFDESGYMLDELGDRIYTEAEMMDYFSRTIDAADQDVQVYSESTRQLAQDHIDQGLAIGDLKRDNEDLIEQRIQLQTGTNEYSESLTGATDATRNNTEVTQENTEALEGNTEANANLGDTSEKTSGKLENSSESMRDFADNTTDATNTIGENVDSMAGDMDTLNNRVLASGKKINSDLLSTLSKAGPGAADIVKYMVNASDAEVSRLSDAFESGGGDAVDAILAELGLPALFNSGVDAIDDIAEGVASNDGLTNAVGRTVSEGAKKANTYKFDYQNAGANLMDGLINGVNSKKTPFRAAMATIVQQGLDAAKRAAGIRSPSRVFRDQVGKQLAAGMGLGFELEAPRQYRSMENVMRREQNVLAHNFTSGYTQMNATSMASQTNSEISSLLGLMERYLPELAEKQLIIDTGEVVGVLADPMDQRLGEIQARRERYA